ncbi:hypothetical protein F8M41_009857 [Gigaspora margarita]|nr:hypothetical protein F8M41_009857 [Gigaspora margarita]
MMLSMRPTEATTLRIIYYETDELNPLEWYNPDYSWYCTGYIKNKGETKNNSEPQPFLSMEKNPERAKKLLTWIQDAIATRKLRNPVYSINRKHSTGVFSKFLKAYGIIAKRLRKIGGKHASRVHSGQNSTSQHLAFLSRIAMRHKMDCHDSGMYYAEGDTSDTDLNSDPEPEPETLAPTPKPINENTSEIEDIYDLYGTMILWIESYCGTMALTCLTLLAHTEISFINLSALIFCVTSEMSSPDMILDIEKIVINALSRLLLAKVSSSQITIEDAIGNVSKASLFR